MGISFSPLQYSDGHGRRQLSDQDGRVVLEPAAPLDHVEDDVLGGAGAFELHPFDQVVGRLHQLLAPHQRAPGQCLPLRPLYPPDELILDICEVDVWLAVGLHAAQDAIAEKQETLHLRDGEGADLRHTQERRGATARGEARQQGRETNEPMTLPPRDPYHQQPHAPALNLALMGMERRLPEKGHLAVIVPETPGPQQRAGDPIVAVYAVAHCPLSLGRVGDIVLPAHPHVPSPLAHHGDGVPEVNDEKAAQKTPTTPRTSASIRAPRGGSSEGRCAYACVSWSRTCPR